MSDTHSSDRSSASCDVSQELPSLIGRRDRTRRERGHSGMARVSLAHDIKHGRDVAVKGIRAELAATPGEFSRFFEELSAITPPGALPSMEQHLSLDARYGRTTLGPPMQ